MNRIDLTGKKFGRLTVLKYGNCYTFPSGQKACQWDCLCECGKLVKVLSRGLKTGRTKSCGCWKKEYSKQTVKKAHESNRLPDGISSFNALYRKYQKNCAIARGYTWELTKEKAHELFKSNCFWCGTEPKQKIQSSRNTVPYIYNGIDRLDNNFGYELKNCVSCCSKCNEMKSDRTINEFLDLIHKIAQRHPNE